MPRILKILSEQKSKAVSRKNLRLLTFVFWFSVLSLPFFFPSCCCDKQMEETLRAGNDLEQGLRNANEEEYLIFAYVEYNRELKENTMRLFGHYWDKLYTIISFLALAGVLIVIWLVVKRVGIIYRFADGQPDILLNTACLAALSLNIASMYGYTAFDWWIVPLIVFLSGIPLMVLAFFFPLQLYWMTGRWQKYIRWTYLFLFAVFTLICLLNKPPWEIPIY